jgi:cell division protein FtsB
MKSFQQKRGFRNILHSKPVLILLFIFLLIFAYGVVRFFGKMRVTQENREIIENKVSELENKKEKLSSDIAKLQTEEGVEESIREKFGLVKEGEGVIIVIEDKNAVEASPEKRGGFFLFLKNLFK